MMAISKGKPRREDAPFFGELVVDLSLSEPSYKLGIDKERISPLESVHEEIYFHTLHFVDVIGRNRRGEWLDYIGRVIPVVHPKRDGKAGHAKITFTGFATDRPAVIVTLPGAGRRQGEAAAGHPEGELAGPSALAAMGAGRTGRDGTARTAREGRDGAGRARGARSSERAPSRWTRRSCPRNR